MQKSKNNLIIFIHTLLDVILVVTAFMAAYFLKKFILPAPYRGLALNPNYYIVLLIAVITMYLTFNIFNLYSPIALKRFRNLFFNMIKAVSTGIIFLIAFLFLANMQDVSRILLGLFYVNIIIFLSVSKGIIFLIFRAYQNNIHNIPNVLVIGSKQRAKQVIELILKSSANIKIIGCLETDEKEIGKVVAGGIRVLGTMEDLKNIVLKGVVDEVIFAMSLSRIEAADKYMLLIEEIGIHVRIIPDWQIHSLLYKPRFARILFDDFFGTPTMVVSPTTSMYRDLFLKSVIDYTSSAIMTLFLLPFILVIGAAIRIFSRGPVFFKQERLGLNGRKFYLYKFRTMVPDAEKRLAELMHLNEADGPAFKIDKDPRIIPVIGRILRKTSLDELPQLFNVLKGEMSLVGPRPPIPSEVEQYDVWQRRRLSMKPGLTCIWQIAPNRNDIDFNRWMEMDLEYIDNWSLKQDFLILFRTMKVVVAGHGR
ncbi:MAG: sugar transferase [Spirochaetes bacterium]|nr:sugar transferase [Spirochaetota bacterium]